MCRCSCGLKVVSDCGFVCDGVVDVGNDVFDGLSVHGVVNLDECVSVSCRSCAEAFPVFVVVGKLGGFATESVDDLLYTSVLFLTALHFSSLPCCMVGYGFGGGVRVRDPFANVDKGGHSVDFDVWFPVPGHLSFF